MGVVKRKNMHVVKIGLAFLIRARIPLLYWEYGFKIIVHLINQIPFKTLNQASLYELLFGSKTLI